MKKIHSIVSTMLLGLGFASASFATPLTVEYKYSVAYIKGACPESVTQLIDSKDHLKLTFDVPTTGAATLTGTYTDGVTVSGPIRLNPVDEYGTNAYRSTSTASTTLQTAGTPFTLQQVWIEGSPETGPWESAFYLNKDKSCLVMTSPAAETNGLSQPMG